MRPGFCRREFRRWVRGRRGEQRERRRADAGVVAQEGSTTDVDGGSVTGSNLGTQELTVGLSSGASQDQLSVGLGTFVDAGDTARLDAGEPVTSEAPDTSASSSLPFTSDVTSTPVIDATGSTEVDATSDGGPEIVNEATWVDLPVTFRLVDDETAGATFTWGVHSVPSGSEVTQRNLEGANTGTVTFVPDVAGRYVLNVSVSVGGVVTTLEGFADVEKVDVAFLKLSSALDGGYVYEPMMVSSDGAAEPFGVGCSFDTFDWDPRDYQYWIDVLYTESRTIGFSYPRTAGDETLLAYHYRRDAVDLGVLHVAKANSDCDANRPTDLQLGWYPTFSPSATQLARIENEGFVQISEFTENPPSTLDSSYASAIVWRNETSIAWAGRGEQQDGEPQDPEPFPVVFQSSTNGDTSVVMDCSPSNNELPLFSIINRVAAAQDGLLILSASELWYVPAMLGDGQPYASCDYLVEGNVLIAASVADFEVAPDHQTVALIISADGNDLPSALMGIGPVNVPFSTQTEAWRSVEIEGGPYHYHTGLHWIAGAQQLIWTGIRYSQMSDDNGVYTELFDSTIYKANADGTYPRRLVYNPEDTYSVVTTGPITLPPFPSVNDPGNY